MTEHVIKIEGKNLAYDLVGYRCDFCGEGMSAKGLSEARKIHDNRLRERLIKKSMEYSIIYGDGSGKPVNKHVLGCRQYLSGHSIDVNGNCNMGCC